MKGIIFNIFEDFIEQNVSPDAWERILGATESGPDIFIGPKTYEDQRFFALIKSCVELYGLPLEGTIRAFGKFTFAKLVGRAPELVQSYQTPEDLLLALDGIIHVEVKKMLIDSRPPKFTVVKRPSGLEVDYQSERKLCLLVEGLLEGLAEHFGRKVEFSHTECMHRGHEKCRFKVKFTV